MPLFLYVVVFFLPSTALNTAVSLWVLSQQNRDRHARMLSVEGGVAYALLAAAVALLIGCDPVAAGILGFLGTVSGIIIGFAVSMLMKRRRR